MAAIHLVTQQLPRTGLDITHQRTKSVIEKIGVLIVSPRGGRIKDKGAGVSARVDHVAEKYDFGVADACGVGRGFGNGAQSTLVVEVEQCWRVGAAVLRRVRDEEICI